MKRMIAFFICAVLSIGLISFKQNDIPFDNCQKVVVVAEKEYKDLDEEPIKSGKDYYHVLVGSKIEYFQKNQDKFDYKGFSLYFDKTFDLKYFKDVFSSDFSSPTVVDDYEIYYGYTCLYNNYKYIDGKKINIQLSKCGDFWIAGFPLILTGF